MLYFLIIITVIGFLGMSYLFPLIAVLVSLISNKSCFFSSKNLVEDNDLNLNVSQPTQINLNIIVPAHNEEEVIKETIDQIIISIDYANHYYKHQIITYEILVVIDNCTDNTLDIVQKLSSDNNNIRFIINHISKGKWRSLNEQTFDLKLSTCNWICFCDSGSIWSKDLIQKFIIIESKTKNLIGFAPAYLNPHGGILEKIHWFLKGNLKKLSL